MELLPFLDLLSTLVFALVGARIAADKGLDYGGIAFIAAVASVSGGTLRNIFLGLKPVWITDYWIVVAVLSAVLITLVFRRVTRIGKTLLVMDTFGLAIATISGVHLAFEQNTSWLTAIILGTKRCIVPSRASATTPGNYRYLITNGCDSFCIT
jgi:uncharacterized membrane protein YeiH